MKKGIMILALFFAMLVANAQKGTYGKIECGTWEIDSTYYTEWEDDSKLPITDLRGNDKNWSYSEWKFYNDPAILDEFCPCGCGANTVLIQKRINDNGLIQIRKHITRHKYIPRPVSDFDKKLQELINR
jgi:hypothetical protein